LRKRIISISKIVLQGYRILIKGNAPKYSLLDKSKSLQDNLVGQTIIEYPTLYVHTKPLDATFVVEYFTK
jgi:hypothetical protein